MFSAVTFNITLNNDITVVLKDLETSLCPPLSRLMLFALDPLIQCHLCVKDKLQVSRCF